MLLAATRRAQHALCARLSATAGGGGLKKRGVTTDASSSPSSSTTTPPPFYSPPPKTPSSQIRQLPVPELNFWESTRPSEWKISQQYWFLAGVGAVSLWATAKALSADNSGAENENGNNGTGAGENGRTKVSPEMSPAKKEMVREQERSPVKKEVP
jgi:hypothetical protein